MDSTDNGILGFMKCTMKGTPIFDGHNGMSYEIWTNGMKVFL
jgi:hypothetical protein